MEQAEREREIGEELRCREGGREGGRGGGGEDVRWRAEGRRERKGGREGGRGELLALFIHFSHNSAVTVVCQNIWRRGRRVWLVEGMI